LHHRSILPAVLGALADRQKLATFSVDGEVHDFSGAGGSEATANAWGNFLAKVYA